MTNTKSQELTKIEAPPVPKRPNEQYFVPQRFNPYSVQNPYAQNPYFAMGPTHNPFGMQMFGQANQQVEATFQSIQSVVQAFSSISMMLESTYMAVHSSFRAVMDVADHFIHLKDSLSGVLSITAMFNTIQWFFKRLLYMFNLVNDDQAWSQSVDKAAKAIEKGQASIFDNAKSQSSSWPMLIFLGVAMSAPYMIYQLQKPAANSNKWMTQEDSHYVGEALYDFATNQPNEISLKAGMKVIIAPKEQQPSVTDWLLATVDGKKAGLVPMNYVKILNYEIIE